MTAQSLPLQSPAFGLVMAYVLFAVGLNLSGVFVVGAYIMGIGQGLASKSGYAGEFFTGVLATVMATPCTAPFMATAVSVALTQPALVAIAIFLTLGCGFALPSPHQPKLACLNAQQLIVSS